MTDYAWDGEFERILRQSLVALPAEQPLPPDADLNTLGLDSIKAIQVLFALEDAYSIAIPDHMLGAALVATPEKLWHAVHSLKVGEERAGESAEGQERGIPPILAESSTKNP